MSTAPRSAIDGSSRRKTSVAASRVGPPIARSPSIAAVVGANSGSCSRPAATRWLRNEIQSRSSSSSRYQRVRSRRPTREVGEERGLAVARVGEDEDDALMDLGGQPIEQAVARERLVPKRRALDLRELDRVAVHPVAVGSMRHRTGAGMPRAGDDRSPRLGLAGQAAEGEEARTIRTGRSRVNGRIASGHARHLGARRSPAG